MANEKYIISKSSNGDIRNEQLRDVIPESERKIFIYKMLETNLRTPVFIPGGKSIIRVEASADSFKRPKLEGDAQFIKGVYSSDIVQKLRNSPSTQSSDITLRYEKVIKLYTDFKFVANESERFFITIDTEYDFNNYANGQQLLYMLNNVSNLDMTGQSDSTDILDKYALNDSHVTELSLENVLVTADDIGDNTELYLIVGKEKLWNNKQILTAAVNKEILIGNIYAASKLNLEGNSDFPIDFVSQTKLTPVKVQPTKIANTLEYVHDWGNLDNIISYETANTLISEDGFDLSKVFTDNDDINLIKDIILFTYASISQYNVVARNAQGKFDPTWKIGYTDTPLTALLDSNDIQLSINKLVEQFQLTHPEKMDNGEWIKIKSFLIAISRYVRWEGAVAKGVNSYNELFLPWYVDITTPIIIETVTGTNKLQLSGDLKFKLKSKWFDIVEKDSGTIKKGIHVKDNVEISKQKIMKIRDKFLLLDDLEDQYTTGSIKTTLNVGDIQTNSTKELEAILYSPGDNFSIEDILTQKIEEIKYDKNTNITWEVPYLPPTTIVPSFAVPGEISGLYNGYNHFATFALQQSIYKSLISFNNNIYTNMYHHYRATATSPATDEEFNFYRKPFTSQTIMNQSINVNDTTTNPFFTYSEALSGKIASGEYKFALNLIPFGNWKKAKSKLTDDKTLIQPYYNTQNNIVWDVFTAENNFKFLLETYYRLKIVESLNLDYYSENNVIYDSTNPYFQITLPNLSDYNNWEKTLSQRFTMPISTSGKTDQQIITEILTNKTFGRYSFSDISTPAKFKNSIGIEVDSKFIQPEHFIKKGDMSKGNISNISQLKDFEDFDSTTSLDRNTFSGITQSNDFIAYITELLNESANNNVADFFKSYVGEIVSKSSSEVVVQFYQWRPKNVVINFSNTDVEVKKAETGKFQFNKNTWSKALTKANTQIDDVTLILSESDNDINQKSLSDIQYLTVNANRGRFIRFEQTNNSTINTFNFKLNSDDDEKINKTEFLFI